MPDLTGMSLTEAQELARPLKLNLQITDSLYIPRFPRGAIFKQIPPAGQKIKKERRVLLSINSVVPKQVNMPSLVGYSFRQAKAVLAANGLVLGRISYAPDMATNNVLGQYYRGKIIAPGSPIEALSAIDLSLGLAPDASKAYIPSLTGKSLDAAKDILSDYCLNLGRVSYEKNIKTAADSLSARIIKQIPEPVDNPAYPLGTNVNLILGIDSVKNRDGR